jgi:hypothetical protein
MWELVSEKSKVVAKLDDVLFGQRLEQDLLATKDSNASFKNPMVLKKSVESNSQVTAIGQPYNLVPLLEFPDMKSEFLICLFLKYSFGY